MACWNPSYSLSIPSISSIFSAGPGSLLRLCSSSGCLWPSILARRRGSFFDRASGALRSAVYIDLLCAIQSPFLAHPKVNSTRRIELCIFFSISTEKNKINIKMDSLINAGKEYLSEQLSGSGSHQGQGMCRNPSNIAIAIIITPRNRMNQTNKHVLLA